MRRPSCPNTVSRNRTRTHGTSTVATALEPARQPQSSESPPTGAPTPTPPRGGGVMWTRATRSTSRGYLRATATLVGRVRWRCASTRSRQSWRGRSRLDQALHPSSTPWVTCTRRICSRSWPRTEWARATSVDFFDLVLEIEKEPTPPESSWTCAGPPPFEPIIIRGSLTVVIAYDRNK